MYCEAIIDLEAPRGEFQGRQGLIPVGERGRYGRDEHRLTVPAQGFLPHFKLKEASERSGRPSWTYKNSLRDIVSIVESIVYNMSSMCTLHLYIYNI